MFAIYGVSGPVFQGTLEALNRMPPVARRTPVTPAQRISDNVEIESATARGAGANRLGAQAIEAYKSMLPEDLDRGPLYHADQIMTPNVIAVRARDEVAHAWRTLTSHMIHQTPVLDDSGQLVGVVSERNLLTAFNVDGGEIRDVRLKRVGDVMTTPVVAASPVTDIRRIARVMLDRDVDGVPIVSEAGVLLGFVSRSDILRAVVTDPPLSIWR
ncbi:MAG: CBS domain-containing protein [Propionivibrio sp.]|jgi:CBS domain-containing protein|nr:CBS domain-containing protein [Propionivibrio sp.]MBP6712130.1 CBS domain-containing protein [Propionivibrio sp.]MBP7525078.1 CBS domain-containing protein [Propionivibrio sp.]MBP8163716.1 CBS domain-containing protein [Propionivibrio sp.]